MGAFVRTYCKVPLFYLWIGLQAVSGCVLEKSYETDACIPQIPKISKIILNKFENSEIEREMVQSGHNWQLLTSYSLTGATFCQNTCPIIADS